MSVTFTAEPSSGTVGEGATLTISVAADQQPITLVGINVTDPSGKTRSFFATGPVIDSGKSLTIPYPKVSTEFGAWDPNVRIDLPGTYKFQAIYTERGRRPTPLTREAEVTRKAAFGVENTPTAAPDEIHPCPCDRGITNNPKKPQDGGATKYDKDKAKKSRESLPWISEDGSMAAREGKAGKIIVDCIDAKSDPPFVCSKEYGAQDVFPSSDDEPLHFKVGDNTVSLVSANGNVAYIRCCLRIVLKVK